MHQRIKGTKDRQGSASEVKGVGSSAPQFETYTLSILQTMEGTSEL